MNLSKEYSFRSLIAFVGKHEPKWLEENAAIIESMQQFPFTNNVWLHGKVGGLKTRLAMAAALRHQYHWEKAIRAASGYPEPFSLCEVLRGTQLRTIANQLPVDREDDIYKFGKPRLLVLDDVDKVDITNDKPLETLYDILDFRQRAKRLTIVTSNYSLQAISMFWGRKCSNESLIASILDRLRPCRAHCVTVARSLRGREPIPHPMDIMNVEPVTAVSPDEAEKIREAFRSGNLRLLANMRAVG